MPAILRSVVSVIAGYLTFAILSFELFVVTGHKPHESAPLPFMAFTTVAGILFAFAGGYLASFMAGRRPVIHSIAVASFLAAGAVASLVATVGHGAIWTQVSALLFMAPAAALAGWFRERQVRRTAATPLS